jgi:hypothetical protein
MLGKQLASNDGSSESTPKLLAFRQKFRWHLDHGTSPHGSVGEHASPWTPPRLRAALKPILTHLTPSDVAIRKWFRQPVVPRELYLPAILTTLFGDDAALAEEKQILRALWDAARLETQGSRSAQDEDLHDLPRPVSTQDWAVDDANNISKELAALYIHPPPPSNDPNTFLLPVSLSLARYPDEIEDLSVRIGLNAADLVPTMKGCQPAGIPQHEHLEDSGGVFTVRGPKEGALLVGKPLDRTMLATMEYTSGALPSVILELRSRRLDLEVVPDDPHHNISANRAKVLQRFLQECQVADEERRVIWCRASLRRKSADEADA